MQQHGDGGCSSAATRQDFKAGAAVTRTEMLGTAFITGICQIRYPCTVKSGLSAPCRCWTLTSPHCEVGHLCQQRNSLGPNPKETGLNLYHSVQEPNDVPAYCVGGSRCKCRTVHRKFLTANLCVIVRQRCRASCDCCLGRLVALSSGMSPNRVLHKGNIKPSGPWAIVPLGATSRTESVCYSVTPDRGSHCC